MTPHDTAASLVAEPAALDNDSGPTPDSATRDAGINETTETNAPYDGVNTHPENTTEAPPGADGAADPAGPAHPDDPAPAISKADESDAAFVLRTFGVLPQRFIKDGVLDRSALAWSVDTYRNLYATRVLSGAAV